MLYVAARVTHTTLHPLEKYRHKHWQLALALAVRTSAEASEAASSTSSSSTLRTRLSAEACSSVLKMESNVLLVLHQLCPHPPRRDSFPFLFLSFFFLLASTLLFCILLLWVTSLSQTVCS